MRELMFALEQESETVTGWEQWKVFRDRWIARKNGIVTQVRESWLKSASPESKAEVGQKFNQLKSQIENKVDGIRQMAMRLEEERESGPSEIPSSRSFSTTAEAIREIYLAKRVDVTLPGFRRPLGV
ncbi:MAG: hypothetical protein WCC32_02505, partial [Terriglobales bacterium]